MDDSNEKTTEKSIFSNICDPDTSDDESSDNIKKTETKPKSKISNKRCKLISPMPAKMSAKQAMENMQKIKSESNRMLREKEVSLPYHRPKAISLKDIMSRRKLPVSLNGKVLPIKMNNDQLKQYSLLLEQRQKEIIELCKSDSDEDLSEEPNQLKDDSSIKITEPSSSIPCNEILKESNDSLADAAFDEIEQASRENIIKDTACSVTVERNLQNPSNREDTIVCESTSEKLVKEIEIINIQTENSSNLDQPESNPTEKPFNSIESHENERNDISMDDNVTSKKNQLKSNSENDSQFISLYYDSENMTADVNVEMDHIETNNDNKIIQNVQVHNTNNGCNYEAVDIDNTEKIADYSETEKLISEEHEIPTHGDMPFTDDFEIDDIDEMIENAEIITTSYRAQPPSGINYHRLHSQVDTTLEPSKRDPTNLSKDSNQTSSVPSAGQTNIIDSPHLINDHIPSIKEPKLTGAPGMVIDLDAVSTAPKKTGLELLKERFSYFSKLKTPEELEREREKRIKPGLQHLKLKRELENEMAEQRCLEWQKRLQEKQNEINTEEHTPEIDEIDKIEAQLEDDENLSENSSECEDEELVEDDIVMDNKPSKKNCLIADEAEESDDAPDAVETFDAEHNDEIDSDVDCSDESTETDSSDEEMDSKPKKRRILRAFEDSDDENSRISNNQAASNTSLNDVEKINNIEIQSEVPTIKTSDDVKSVKTVSSTASSPQIADEDLQLAQSHKSLSEDLFSSQEPADAVIVEKSLNNSCDRELSTQTFSIMDSSKGDTTLTFKDSIEVASGHETQSDVSTQKKLEDIVGMCSGSFTQNLIPPNIPENQSKSEEIGDDLLALCTGKFYDNQFVSQPDPVEIQSQDSDAEVLCEITVSKNANNESDPQVNEKETTFQVISESKGLNTNNSDLTLDVSKPKTASDNLVMSNNIIPNSTKADEPLKSILEELNDPEFDSPKPKYFCANTRSDMVQKKKFIIESDDESCVDSEEIRNKKKKSKRKKAEKRALQISDDEDEISEQAEEEDEEELESVIDDYEKIVEYDSEENEIEVTTERIRKKHRPADFLEQEAELSSEDEWIGSGDEDERDLDRMEREDGDDEVFNEDKLQRELGQIHMRDVLDQDKRDVRLLQELLFEDGDLGSGGRQRKFRWQNADGEEEIGTIPDELGGTQEEEFESEEQWRKQRHEREVFLRQMKEKEHNDSSVNVSVNRNTIIKANLYSKATSSALHTCDTNISTHTETTLVVEKKTTKDIPSPTKSYSIFQQSYHGSLLQRGRGALARLAAIAAPLAGDDNNTPRIGSLAPTSNRNFVFAAVTPDEEPKAPKRKAESNPCTPKLMKKLKTDEQKRSRSSLIDHLGT